MNVEARDPVELLRRHAQHRAMSAMCLVRNPSPVSLDDPHRLDTARRLCRIVAELVFYRVDFISSACHRPSRASALTCRSLPSRSPCSPVRRSRSGHHEAPVKSGIVWRMRKRRRADARRCRRSVFAVAHQVIAVVALGRLDSRRRLARRERPAPSSRPGNGR